jgi:hypothetical protein
MRRASHLSSTSAWRTSEGAGCSLVALQGVWKTASRQGGQRPYSCSPNSQFAEHNPAAISDWELQSDVCQLVERCGALLKALYHPTIPMLANRIYPNCSLLKQNAGTPHACIQQTWQAAVGYPIRYPVASLQPSCSTQQPHADQQKMRPASCWEGMHFSDKLPSSSQVPLWDQVGKLLMLPISHATLSQRPHLLVTGKAWPARLRAVMAAASRTARVGMKGDFL